MTALQELFETTTNRRKAYELQLRQAGGLGQQLLTQGTGTALSIGSSDQEDAYRHFCNWPYAVFNLVGKRVGGQPVHAGEIVAASPNPERRILHGQILKNRLPSRIYQKAVVNKDLKMLPDHPVIDSLKRPNPLQKKFEFLYFSATNLFLTGECYWIGGAAKTEDGERVEIWAIPSSWVQPIHKKGLFAEFHITPTGVVEGFTLPAENVARTYLPDPSDPKGSFSALRGVMSAIKTDDYIQTSQQQTFEQGLVPPLVVTVAAKRAFDGGVGERPVLTGEQRRQITRALREMFSRQVNAGDPAILDGLIESIHKLNLTPQEMDWITSSDLVKQRIFQATGLNPISAGHIVGANRAQAAEAERQACVNAINPIIDALSESMTDFLGPMFDSPERLVVWIEPCEPMDRELNDRRWEFARKNDDVTSNEFRANQLNLEPREEAVPRNQLLSTVGGMTGSVQILTAMGQGFIPPTAASTLLQLFLEIDDDLASTIVGEGEASPPAPTEPAPEEPEEVIDDEAPEEVDEIEEEPAAARSTKAKTVTRLKRTDIGEIHGKQVEQMQEVVAAKMADPFRRSVQETARRIAGRSDKPDKENAEKQAERIVKATFDLDKANREIFTAAAEVLPVVFAAGVMAELVILEALKGTKRTSAQEIAERLEIDTSLLPFSIGSMPEWLLEAARESMGEAFAEDYWQKIGETTRDDIEITVRDGIESGLSMRKVAAAIAEKHGDQYSKIRAMLVARTETPNALLSGHAKGISQLEEDTGFPIGKEWLSAFQTFTRPSHAALDAKRTKDAKGMFTLNGVQIPWPAHTNLPAKDRANCLCNIISTVSADALEDVSQAAEAELTGVPARSERTDERCGGLDIKAQSKSCKLSKSEIAKANAAPVGKNIQRYSEENNEAEIAEQIGSGAKSMEDNEPHDIQVRLSGKLHGIELKTMVSNKSDKLTMKRSAMERKAAWEKKNKGIFHTLVLNDEGVIPGKTIQEKSKALNRFLATGDDKGFDFSKRKMFYRRGYGSFRVRNMHEIKDVKELRKLLRADLKKLPHAAGGPKQ